MRAGIACMHAMCGNALTQGCVALGGIGLLDFVAANLEGIAALHGDQCEETEAQLLKAFKTYTASVMGYTLSSKAATKTYLKQGYKMVAMLKELTELSILASFDFDLLFSLILGMGELTPGKDGAFKGTVSGRLVVGWLVTLVSSFVASPFVLSRRLSCRCLSPRRHSCRCTLLRRFGGVAFRVVYDVSFRLVDLRFALLLFS